MALRLKNWFFTNTSTSAKKGTRLKNGDLTQEATFRDLIDSNIFKTEANDKATTTTNGHVRLATSAEAKSGASQPTDGSIVVTPEQLPTVEPLSNDYGTDGSDYDGQTISITIDNTESKNIFKLKLADAFYSWLKAYIGGVTPSIAYATNDQIGSRAVVDASVKPNQLPEINSASFTADGDINTFDGQGLDIARVAAANGSGARDTYGLNISTAFRNWLKGRLDSFSTSGQALAYVYWTSNFTGTPTANDKGDGSVTTPYSSLGYALHMTSASNKSIIVLNSGNVETLPSSSFYTYTQPIFLNDGVVITQQSGSAQSEYLFTAGSAGFKITGNGTFKLFNRSLMDCSSFNTSFTGIVYSNLPVFRKELNKILEIKNSYFYAINSAFVASSPAIIGNLFSTNSVAGNLILRNNILRGFRLNINLTGVGSNSVIQGTDFYDTASGNYCTVIGESSSGTTGYGVSFVNNKFDLVNTSGKVGIDISGVTQSNAGTAQTSKVTSNNDFFERANNSDISGTGKLMVVVNSITSNTLTTNRPTITGSPGFLNVPTGSILGSLQDTY